MISDARPAEELSAGDLRTSVGWRSGRRRQCRRPVRDQRSGSGQAGTNTRKQLLAEDENDSQRGRCRHLAGVSASRNCAWKSTASAPPIWASACPISRRRLNTMVAGQVVSSFHVGRRPVRRARCAPRSEFRTSAEGADAADRAFDKARSGEPGSSGAHQAGNRSVEHRAPQPAAPGDPQRQPAAGRLAGRRDCTS